MKKNPYYNLVLTTLILSLMLLDHFVTNSIWHIVANLALLMLGIILIIINLKSIKDNDN